MHQRPPLVDWALSACRLCYTWNVFLQLVSVRARLADRGVSGRDVVCLEESTCLSLTLPYRRRRLLFALLHRRDWVFQIRSKKYTSPLQYILCLGPNFQWFVSFTDFPLFRSNCSIRLCVNCCPWLFSEAQFPNRSHLMNEFVTVEASEINQVAISTLASCYTCDLILASWTHQNTATPTCRSWTEALKSAVLSSVGPSVWARTTSVKGGELF